MHSQSLLASARALEDDADAVLAQRSLDSDRLVRDYGAAMTATLCDLAELVRASLPVPTPDERSQPSHDEVVRATLSSVYESGGCTPATLTDTVDGDGESVLAAARTAGRLSRAGPQVLVPLGTEDGPAQNWPLVMSFVDERLSVVAEKCQRIQTRVVQARGEDTVCERLWRTVVEMLADTRAVVRHSISHRRWLGHVASRPDDRPRTFASWTIDSLSDT